MGNILKSKWFWAAAVALVLLGLYAVLGFYAAPRIVRSQATDFVREKYGRELALGEIRIDPFKLQAEIKDLSLPDTDGQPMLAFRRFFVDFELSSLWQRAYVFKDVQLDAPLARTVIRPDGSVNLADLALPAEEDADEPLPAVWIQQFALGDGTVQFADLTRRVPLERQFTPVDFELENFQDYGGRRRVRAHGEDTERRIAGMARQVRARTADFLDGRTRDHEPERAGRARGRRRRTAFRHSTG